jgi:SPP1 gp7 family putative phage head morphogenesis protein
LGDEPQVLTLSKEQEEKIRKQLEGLFEGMMSALYKQKGANLDISILASDEAQQFINTHAAVLDSTFQQVPMSDNMRRRLQRSDYIFSGMKTFHELNEAFPSLLDENGDRKPFEHFLNDVQKIDSTYNSNYLHAEYNFVQASAQMAAKWERFAEDGDRYNLQYRTAGDGKVRPEHAALNGVTLPPSDPFWEEYYPPNGWNCRCTVTQVRKSKYPATAHDEAVALGEEALQRDKKGIFHFNPGKQEKAVPDYNPYTIRRCRDCDIANGKQTLAFVPENDLCAACRLIRQAQNARTNQRLLPSEFREAANIAVNWADRNLDNTIVNGENAKRTVLKTADNYSIGVGKKFFTETAAKNKRNPQMVHVLKTATEFKEWVPKATRIRIEQGNHHNFQFSVYQVEYQGQVIEFKCKITEGELLYTMKFI